jgi:hypothetical protein
MEALRKEERRLLRQLAKWTNLRDFGLTKESRVYFVHSFDFSNFLRSEPAHQPPTPVRTSTMTEASESAALVLRMKRKLMDLVNSQNYASALLVCQKRK